MSTTTKVSATGISSLRKAPVAKKEKTEKLEKTEKPEKLDTEIYEPKLDDVYRQLNERSHVLLRPDIFIGSTAIHPCSRWVMETDLAISGKKGDETEPETEKGKIENKIVLQEIPYIAGLGKIFDEAITNARDHALRMTFSKRADKRPVTYIQADVCSETGWISIQNDGSGIDVAKHSELHIYYPELIFGHFRSSTNYDEDRVFNTGAGKNGYGIKLTLIWSKEAVLETVDSERGLKYTQRFMNNLETIEEPVITKVRVGTKPYTMIRFLPDYVRFGLKDGKISREMYALLYKRVLDMAGVSGPGLGLGEGAVISSEKGVGAEKGKGLVISWKGEPVSVRNFQQYINLYIGNPKDGPEGVRVYEAPHPRWEYAVALSSSENFMHVSFVNGISTANGGSHVDYIMNQLTSKLVKMIELKKKVKVSSASLKQQMVVFLRCDVEEPSFDNQSKDRLVMPVDKFGSSCTISTAFVEGVYKLGVADFAMKMTNMREEKKTDGKKKKTILGIPKYSPAEYAGTKRSNEAILILTEGDSAKASVNSGISSEDRKRIGVFPLKGKLMNVRDELATKIAKNEEISNLKRILGLEQGKKYKSMEDIHVNLRYSKVLILCDQDHDGSHIKGLLVNLFQSEWPDLYRIPGFLAFMNTPILTATKGAMKKLFYNNGEYEQWKTSLISTASGGGGGDGGFHLWKIKYFKGLGTSTSAEFRDYFANKKVVDFTYTGDKSDDTVDLVFRKKRADDRKTWMGGYDRNLYLDTSKPKVAYEEFFNNEMIHFSVYSCERALPNIVDGLKSSQRKILYCAFKRNLVGELKVAQFAGYVSEHACYHHGETSLGGTIIGMAQTFVGSNNINLLMPCGQFGTRNLGGNEAASVRYIFTRLNPITRYLFPKEDDEVLNYLDDDGTKIEPDYYVPIIPMVLVNGCEGIGTGYSCSIPAFNPTQIISSLRERILALGGGTGGSGLSSEKEWVPYYEGFTGRIDSIGKGKYLTRGIYRRVEDDTIFISELPVGTWTGYLYYKKYLEELVLGKFDDKGKQTSPPVIKEYQMTESEVKVMITVRFLHSEQLGDLERTTYPNGVNGVEKILALTTTYGTQNMMLFDTHCKLKNYETVEVILDEFYAKRYEIYRKRKAHLIRVMQSELNKLANKARFIQEIVSGKIDLRKSQNDGEVDELLEKLKFDRMMTDGFKEKGTEMEEGVGGGGSGGNYKYLTEMRLNTLTKERADKLKHERDESAAKLQILESTTLETMWLRELDALEGQYKEDRQWRILLQNPEGGVGGNSNTNHSSKGQNVAKKSKLRK